MKVKTNELIGLALDHAVNQIEECCDDPMTPMFSTSWVQGGPIIEREEIFLAKSLRGVWTALMYTPQHEVAAFEDGPTPLIAAMRAFVTSKLGDEVEIPEELVK